MQYNIEVYQTDEGKIPFNEWLEDLDVNIRQKIRMKLARLSFGNFGNCKSIDNGIFEVKIDSGPGYRIYFCLVGSNRTLILYAGTKNKQQKDIDKAKRFLKDLNEK